MTNPNFEQPPVQNPNIVSPDIEGQVMEKLPNEAGLIDGNFLVPRSDGTVETGWHSEGFVPNPGEDGEQRLLIVKDGEYADPNDAPAKVVKVNTLLSWQVPDETTQSRVEFENQFTDDETIKEVGHTALGNEVKIDPSVVEMYDADIQADTEHVEAAIHAELDADKPHVSEQQKSGEQIDNEELAALFDVWNSLRRMSFDRTEAANPEDDSYISRKIDNYFANPRETDSLEFQVALLATGIGAMSTYEYRQSMTTSLTELLSKTSPNSRALDDIVNSIRADTLNMDEGASRAELVYKHSNMINDAAENLLGDHLEDKDKAIFLARLCYATMAADPESYAYNNGQSALEQAFRKAKTRKA